MKVLVHLVSGQNLPNYVASKIVRADEEIFLFTAGSVNNLKTLKQVLKPKQEFQIDAWDYATIRKACVELIRAFPEAEVVLNFTGGTKIMSQAAFDAFRDSNCTCFYINTEQENYHQFLSSQYQNPQVFPFPSGATIPLTDYISLQDQTLVPGKNKISQEQDKLFNFLKLHFGKYNRSILNCASRYNKDKNPKVSEPYYNGMDELTCEAEFVNGDSLFRLSKNKTMELECRETGHSLIEFGLGKWFEYWCYSEIYNLAYFDDLQWDCHIPKKIKHPTDQYTDKNDFDILGLKGIFPVMFECKSGTFKSEDIDKIVQKKQTYLGRYSACFLITFSVLSKQKEFGRLLKERLRDNNIKQITVHEIAQIPKLLNRENLK